MPFLNPNPKAQPKLKIPNLPIPNSSSTPTQILRTGHRGEMGRRRRFARLDDDADEEDVSIKFKPSGGASSSGANPRKPQPQPQQRRRLAADDDEDEEEVELEEEEDDEKDLEAMRRAEEEERREQEAETKTRRRRGRPKRRRDPESEEEEPEEVEPLEEEPREEENTEAVPVAVGDPVKITGKGRKQKKHYASFEYEGNTFELVSRRLRFSLPDFCSFWIFGVSGGTYCFLSVG